MHIKKLMARAIIAAFGLLIAMGSPAQAVDLFEYDFTALTGAGPTPTHQGSFTLSYDGTDYSLAAIDYAIGSTVFDLTNAGVLNNLNSIVIGGTECSLNCINVGTNDFFLVLLQSGTPGVFDAHDFVYAQIGFNDFGNATPEQGALTVTQVTSGVPEPGTWALMLFGFGVASLSLRRFPSGRPLTIA